MKKKIIYTSVLFIALIATLFIYNDLHSQNYSNISNENVVQKSKRKAIKVKINNKQFNAHLNKSIAAQELYNRLPQSIDFNDLSPNFDEKIGDLNKKINIKGMSKGDDPRPGDIGYWSPQPRIVLYFGDVVYWEGIHVIGSFDKADKIRAIKIIQSHKSNFNVKISRR